jgi:hypothetical protein
VSVHQTQAFLALRVHGQHRMHKHPYVSAIADDAKPALAPALRLVIEFAGILNSQNMATHRRDGGEQCPSHCASVQSPF